MKNHVLRRLLAAALVAVSLLFAPALKATPLLTAAYEAQLETWLGQGDLNFTNIFTKAGGDDAFDFHAAADNKGATFLLMRIYGTGPGGDSALPSQIVGGYNSQSWESISSWHVTPNNADRTAFIYNLSSGTIQRQNLIGEGAGDLGKYQTYNVFNAGPGFGGGSDLSADHTLNAGYADNLSYGGTSGGLEIVTGGPNRDLGFSEFYIGELEVYTFSTATSVPDAASTLGLLARIFHTLIPNQLENIRFLRRHVGEKRPGRGLPRPSRPDRANISHQLV